MLPQKNKENHQPAPTDYRRTVSPAPLPHKHKNQKEPQPKTARNLKEITIVPIKNKPHHPSKSTQEQVENKHYNSPDLGIPQTVQHTQINPFTFTQLLQQQSRNQQLPLSNKSAISKQQTGAAFSANIELHKENNMRKTPITVPGLTPESPSLYYDAEVENRLMEFSGNLAPQPREMHDCWTRPNQKLASKSISKSPVRLANTHKLNNTPKLKQNQKTAKDYEPKKQIKTFASVLNSTQFLPEQSFHTKQESINLLCSQKIDKFIQTETQIRTVNSPLHKNNLLSTGVINLSQPGKNQSGQCLFSISSKDYALERLKANRIISEQNIVKKFEDEEDSNLSFHQQLLEKTTELQQKIGQIKNWLTNQIKNSNQDAFLDSICSHFNPEMDLEDLSSSVRCFEQIASRAKQSFEALISKLQRMSQAFASEIYHSIDIVNQSKASLIAWNSVQYELAQADKVENQLCKTQLLALRLENVKRSLEQQVSMESKQLNQIQSLNNDWNELNKIDTELTEFLQTISSKTEPASKISQTAAVQQQLVHFQKTLLYVENIFQNIEKILYQ